MRKPIVPGYVTTMNGIAGVGFYSDGYGDLPLAFGKEHPVQYYILMLK